MITTDKFSVASPVLVTGANGLVGSSLIRNLKSINMEVIALTRAECNLLDINSVKKSLKFHRPKSIIHAAAQVGGVLGNSTFPHLFINNNLLMQWNLINVALEMEIEDFIFIGSSCIYPVNSKIPINESDFMTGKLENTNKWYATAKIAGIMQIDAIRQEFGLPWFTTLPCNIYGPNDNFALQSGHVIPSLLYKFIEAKYNNDDFVEVWGTGEPHREFIHVDDLANGIIHSTKLKNSLKSPYIINIGSGQEITIRSLAKLIAEIIEFKGSIVFNSNKPDGVFRKTLNSDLLLSTGWKSKFTLKEGLTTTIQWLEQNFKNVRKFEMSDN